MSGDLIYCATPSRLVDKTGEIMDFVTSEGNAPFHPFQAFPYERYEGNQNIGRARSMEFCFRAIDICDEVYVFGVSKGVLDEILEARKKRKIVRLQLRFDPEWVAFYEKLRKDYDGAFDGLFEKEHRKTVRS